MNWENDILTMGLRCKLCGESDAKAADGVYTYTRLVPVASVCYRCADAVANAYSKAHSGTWLTWPNPPREKPAKEPIKPKMRKAVFERDGYRCKFCDSHKDLCADHIHPESKGGKGTLENLQTLCRTCNAKKGNKVLA